MLTFSFVTVLRYVSFINDVSTFGSPVRYVNVYTFERSFRRLLTLYVYRSVRSFRVPFRYTAYVRLTTLYRSVSFSRFSVPFTLSLRYRVRSVPFVTVKHVPFVSYVT